MRQDGTSRPSVYQLIASVIAFRAATTSAPTTSATATTPAGIYVCECVCVAVCVCVYSCGYTYNVCALASADVWLCLRRKYSHTWGKEAPSVSGTALRFVIVLQIL